MNAQLSSRISSAMELPTLPPIVERLSAAIDSPDAGAADVGEMIGADPTLTTKVLSVANSASYGLAERCRSARQACTVLGLRAVRNIVVHAALLEHYEHLKTAGYDVSAIWRDGPLVGATAAQIARCMPASISPRVDDAYLAGLVHDIGQLILLENVGDLYVTIQAAAACALEHLEAYEARELGCTHSEVGARAVESWSYGEHVRDAVARHHAPVAGTTRPLTAVVALADQIVECLNMDHFTAAMDAATPQLLGVLRIQRAQVAEIVEALHARMHGVPVTAERLRAPLPSTPEPRTNSRGLAGSARLSSRRSAVGR